MSTPVIFFVVLSILVLVHELGHFLTAKFLGIKVEEFAFGLPFTRPIISVKRGETRYSLYPLLFGGFVRLHGEESKVEQDTHRSFWNRGKKQRVLVIVAGVIMNVILALVAFVGLYAVIGIPTQVVDKVTVLKVEPTSPADVAGLKPDDRIIEVEGKSISTGQEFGELMKSWAGLEVNLTVERGQTIPLFEGIWTQSSTLNNVAITPRLTPPEGQGPLGVNIGDFPYLLTQKCSVLSLKCTGGAMVQGLRTTGVWVQRVVDGLRTIGQSLSRGHTPEGVSGPIGIYQITDVVAKGGFLPVLELTAILSINLAIFNILPIPALDGGRLFFIWLEWVRRRRVTPELEQKINSVGMAVLLTLIALITLQDVIRLGFIQKLLGK